MRFSWNEIRTRAAAFAEEFKNDKYERGEAQTFYNEFFEIFGVTRRRVATFEERVKLLGDKRGRIDLFWKGVLLVEAKSEGENLVKAKKQALDYFPGLKERELPRWVLVCDFQNFELYDLDGEQMPVIFKLADLPKFVEAFGFILGREKITFKDQDPVNIDAAELMGELHDALEESGYTGNDLERFLVRLLFCLFADDASIFEPRGLLLELLQQRTSEDGSDTGQWLTTLFEVLNTPEKNRQKNLDEDLAKFPHVNGELFKDRLRTPQFDSRMREKLIEAAEFSWQAVSPAIFGSLFQSVMDKEERREQGAHYTNEKNILKIIQPLILDDLRTEFSQIRSLKGRDRNHRLVSFWKKLGELKFLDPACGCGNFLILAYRELRELEIDVLKSLLDDRALPMTGESRVQQLLARTGSRNLSVIDVNQFFGIEIGEFPARIAEVAMWMMDHIMNNRISLAFGEVYVRIPLQKSPQIVVGNALDMDWGSLLAPRAGTFVFGNPPFRGHQYRTKSQQADMARIWGREGQVNRLDYVTCWFKKAVEYGARDKHIKIGLVATNSITQGEQCGILWPRIFASGASLFFAHRTFQWNSEARGKAAVHCVIAGISWRDSGKKVIFEYDHPRGEPHASEVSRINGYLIEGPQYAVPARSQPSLGMLRMNKGSQPTDGARLKTLEGSYVTFSNLILEEQDREELLAQDPNAEKWLRPYVGGDELISGKWRWCLWLRDADPGELRQSAPIQERLDRVRSGRLKSPTESVRAFAKYPTLFTQDRQPSEPYLAIPEVSSESREYIPIDILQPNVIASNKLQIIVGAPIYYFGILTSAMHMAWMRAVAGRLESRYSYAPAVYNSFPWPQMSDAKKADIEVCSQAVMDARAKFSHLSLDDLYDPDSMPPILRAAHDTLDREVDGLYRRGKFRFERERVEHLFGLYERIRVAQTVLDFDPSPGTRKRSKRPNE